MNIQYTTPDEFKDIAPFDDCEINDKLSQLVKEPGFEHAIRYVMPDVDYPAFVEGLLKIDNKKDFQYKVVAPFLELLASKTTAGLSISGVENLDKNKCYTFITNHRDIVLDASFLNVLLWKSGFQTTAVAIGSNLLIYEWISDLVKLNKSFLLFINRVNNFIESNNFVVSRIIEFNRFYKYKGKKIPLGSILFDDLNKQLIIY